MNQSAKMLITIKEILDEIDNDFAFGQKIVTLLHDGDTAGFVAALAKKGFYLTEAEWQMYIDRTMFTPVSRYEIEKAYQEGQRTVGVGVA
jgi:hypothetical protein